MPQLCKAPYVETDEFSEIFNMYPYPLSDFQKYAIEGICKGHHVLTCAPTGSGKTLAAEFAIEHFQKHGKKVIYTSPIKALSNQKFHEFSQKYPHISFGLLTGDIKTNPGADVLIMTTEILMNKLFHEQQQQEEEKQQEKQEQNPLVNSYNHFDMDLNTELACVIFDEVHYINDADRGHVWEQTIVLLPPHVQMVMLSATIDDPVGFADWCERNHSKTVYLAQTTKREVPLTHYVFWATTEDPFKKIKDKSVQQTIRDGSHQFIEIRSASGVFKDEAYHTMAKLHHIFNKERMYMKRNFVLNRLCEHLRDKEMLPAIVFVFSRKHVETCAKAITTNLLEFDSKVPYIMRQECEKIIRKFPNYREYLELPEYTQLISLLEKGIGIHHSGMIPVLRELVEIMISRKQIKLLFATESFAIGLDCPIRTAVFTDLSKYDRHGNRFLYSHEYTQMAGRAGRRGIDTIGNAVHCNNLFDMPTLTDYKTVLNGMPQKLVSKFRISYSILLSVLAKHADATVLTLELFVRKSMMSKELDQRKQMQERVLAEYADKLQTCASDTLQLQNQEKHLLCKRFCELKEYASLDLLSQKKKKEIDRELAEIKTKYPSVDEDAKAYSQNSLLEIQRKKEEEHYVYMDTYIQSEIQKVSEIMTRMEYIHVEHPHLCLTTKGTYASMSAEIPGILACEIIAKTDFFAGFTAKQLVQLFSMFTQIRVAEEMRINRCPPCFACVNETIENLTKLEEENFLSNKNDFANEIQYDLIDEMDEWCDSTTEQECKYFIQVKMADKGISVGDFTKAVLKISTISREVSAICECAGKIDTMHRLSQIDGLILKYVTTAQSLYV